MRWVKIIFCLIIGAVAFYYGLKLLRLYLKVKSWDRATAIVLNKSVVQKKLASGSSASKTIYIEYDYVYNANHYKNNKVFLVELINGEKGFTTKNGENFLRNVGHEVEIFVDPKDPAQSVIYCDGLWLYLFTFITGIILLFVGLVYLVLSF